MGELISFAIVSLLFSSYEVEMASGGQFPSQYFEVGAPQEKWHWFDPVVSAQAVAIVDAKSGGKIWERSGDEERAMASLTKLMTALIIVENHDLSEVVTVPYEATRVEGARMGLAPGESMTVRNLLKGLMIRSGNDAALALALFHSGSESAFVEEMNRRAYFLGMESTQFQNPHGLDEVNHFSTAHDLSILARKVLEFDAIRQYAQTKKEVVVSSDGLYSHELNTTNFLLFSPFPIFGLKTGTTDAAGQCLIALVRIGGQESVIVVLGSASRFDDTKALLSPLL